MRRTLAILLGLAVLPLGACTLATYERAIEPIGYEAPSPAKALPAAPVVIMDFTDAREDREHVASARTAREWRYATEQDIPAWVSEGLRRGLADAGATVLPEPTPEAIVVYGRVLEVKSEGQANLTGANRVESKVRVAVDIDVGGRRNAHNLAGKNVEWGITEVRPALRGGLAAALADLTGQLAATLAADEGAAR